MKLCQVTAALIALFAASAVHAESVSLLSEAQIYYVQAQQYVHGSDGERDPEKAGELLGRAAALGFDPAIKDLDRHYKHCRTTLTESVRSEDKEDDAKTVESCLVSASSGNVEAQYVVGLLYKMGEMVERTPEKGTEWLVAAARQGHVMAQYEMLQAHATNSVLALQKGDRDSVSEIFAYGWMCVLEKQANTAGSPGIKQWNKGYAEGVRKAKAGYDKAAKRPVSGWVLRRTCKSFVEDYYQPSPKPEIAK